MQGIVFDIQEGGESTTLMPGIVFDTYVGGKCDLLSVGYRFRYPGGRRECHIDAGYRFRYPGGRWNFVVGGVPLINGYCFRYLCRWGEVSKKQPRISANLSVLIIK